MSHRPCPTCGEDTIVPKPGHILGRACRCEREKQAKAAEDRRKPRCGAVLSDFPTHQMVCGDPAGHEGDHGQKWVSEVRKKA